MIASSSPRESSVEPTASVKSGRPRTVQTPAEERSVLRRYKTRAVEKRVLELSQPRVFEKLQALHHYSQSAHLFSDNSPLWMQFCEWLKNTLPMTSRYTIVCGHARTCTKRVRRERVRSASTKVTSEHKLHAIRERGNHFHFNVEVWVGIGGAIVVGPICFLRN